MANLISKTNEDHVIGEEEVTVHAEMTPASIFPPNVTDYFQIDDMLTFEEKVIRNKVRKFMEDQLAPIMAEYWERAEFPFEVIPELRRLNITGGNIKGYGCPGMSITASCIIIAEMARVDASFSSFFAVHSYLSMQTIGRYGSEAQKHKYLPSLAHLETIACWAATEPGSGSDLNSLTTTATKVEGGWILQGQKRWIGNSLFADFLIIIARNTITNQVNGFIVKKGAPQLQVRKMENKIGLRILQNGDIILDGVFVPDEDRLPGINSFEAPSRIIVFMRLIVAWQPIGISMGVYDMCYRYLKERDEASSSSAGGLSKCETMSKQEKVLLLEMLSNIQAMYLLGWRTCRLYDEGRMTDGQASLSKAWITLKGRETVSIGRQLLGETTGQILTDFLVAKAFCDVEVPYTYDGTYDINTLIVGKEITGISSFRPSSRVMGVIVKFVQETTEGVAKMVKPFGEEEGGEIFKCMAAEIYKPQYSQRELAFLLNSVDILHAAI